MSKLFTLTTSALVLAAAGSVPLNAHTLQTAAGTSVSHSHYGVCLNASTCPPPDATVESTYGFTSGERVYSGTYQWNCHGRTFDARRSWPNYADPWLNSDAPVCPLNPVIGDTVIWWGPNGLTSHSVTIVGSWNNLSTTVMSKYGALGQYRHALSKTIGVYGGNWAVTRFMGGTVIYSGLQTGDTAIGGAATPSDASARLQKEREEMPWYETVVASQLLFDIERPRLIAQISGLREETRERFIEAVDNAERIDILLEDLRHPEHFEFLAAYNSPAHSEDFITGIEAGKLLVRLAELQPKLKPAIVSGLSEALELKMDAVGTDAEELRFADEKRGAALHFLSRLLPKSERASLKERLQGELKSATAPSVAGGGVPSYTEHWLSKM